MFRAHLLRFATMRAFVIGTLAIAAVPTFAQSGTWVATGSMKSSREDQTATQLQSGMVLVAGGFNGSTELSSAELYDPSTGGWNTTGSMNIARDGHTATLLQNGQVLVTGGFNTATNGL